MNAALYFFFVENNDNRPTGSIETSPEFKFGIMEWVTNWTFMITQTHFYCSF